MGILDSKSRILDAILTVEGRRQMAEGTFDVSYATFTDTDMFYESDAVEGHVDPTDRIYLEASNLPQDQVVFEANDAGNIISFRDNKLLFDKLDNVALLPKPLEILFNQGGIPSAYQLNFGAKIETRKPGIDSTYGSLAGSSAVKAIKDGMGVGFSITDSANLKADFILDPQFNAGIVSSSYASSNKLSGSYYIGVKGGINARDLTALVQTVILSASLVSGTYPGAKDPGPHVIPVDRDNSIYLTDFSGSHNKIVVNLLTASLNLATEKHPFVVEQALLGGRKDRVELPNADFSSKITGILTSSFDNFQEIRVLSTIDPIFLEDEFKIFPQEISFDVNQLKFLQTINTKQRLNTTDSLFSDSKLSNTLNFKYLPPIVKTSDAVLPDKTDITATVNYQLGNYPPIGANEQPMNFAMLMNQLQGAIKRNVFFEQTTRNNNLLCQIFEVSKNSIQKLDIIDYGYIDQGPGTILKKRVYFVGKVFLDDRNTTCFLNIFTLIFSQDAGEVA